MFSHAPFFVLGLVSLSISAQSSAHDWGQLPENSRLTPHTHSEDSLANRLFASNNLDQDIRNNAITRALLQLDNNRDQIPHDRDHSFEVRDVIIDQDGTEHVRFDRRYKGLRVLGGDLVVHTMADGNLDGFNVAFTGQIQMDTNKLLAAEQAMSNARKEWKGTVEKIWKPEPVIYARQADPILAYEVVIEGHLDHGDPSEMHTIVDALYGKIIAKWEGVETSKGTGKGVFSGSVPIDSTQVGRSFQLKDATRGDQSTFNMNNWTFGNGTLFTDRDNVWGDGTLNDPVSIGIDAQYGASKTWDYYLTKHNRKGIKNNGVGAGSRVHYGRRYNNAYWTDTCFCMTYGDGDPASFNPFVALDVAGHEMTHGVTSATANLNYEGESGGLNEATSDIFGSLVEWYTDLATDKPDYLIGEMLFKNNSGDKAIRFMHKPSLDGSSPDCYQADLGDLDVHYSSGIGNHFFYLLAEGSHPASGLISPTCNGTEVKGIGRDTAAAIWYRALTVYMTSETTYAGAREATLRAAKDLYRPDSIEVKTVTIAWDAVAVK